MWELRSAVGTGRAFDMVSASPSFADAPLASFVSALFLPGGTWRQRRPWERQKADKLLRRRGSEETGATAGPRGESGPGNEREGAQTEPGGASDEEGHDMTDKSRRRKQEGGEGRSSGKDGRAEEPSKHRGAVARPTTALLTGTTTGEIYCWQGKRCTSRIRAHGHGSVRGLALSPCGRFVASGGADGRVCVWAVADGALVVGAEGGRDLMPVCAFDVAAANPFAFAPGAEAMSEPLGGQERHVSHTLLAVASLDCFVGPVNKDSGDQRSGGDGDGSRPDDILVASLRGGALMQICGLWTAAAAIAGTGAPTTHQTGATIGVQPPALRCLMLLSGHAGPVCAAACCPVRDARVYTLTPAGVLAQWDGVARACVGRLRLAPVPGAIRSAHGTARPRSGSQSASADDAERPSTSSRVDDTCCVAVSFDGGIIAAAAQACGLALASRADAGTGRPLALLRRAHVPPARRDQIAGGAGGAIVTCLAWAPDGGCLAAGTRDGRVALFNAHARASVPPLEGADPDVMRPYAVCEGASARIVSVDWAAGAGAAVMACSAAREMLVFSRATGGQLTEAIPVATAGGGDVPRMEALLPQAVPRAPSLSDHSAWASWSSPVGFAVMGAGADVHHVCASHGRKLLALSAPSGVGIGEDYDGDATSVPPPLRGSASLRHSACLMRFPAVVAGAPRLGFAGHGGRLRTLAFSARDEHLLTAGGSDGTAILWDVVSGVPASGDGGARAGGGADSSGSDLEDDDDIASFIESIDASVADLDLDTL